MIKNIIIFLLFIPLFAGIYYINELVGVLEFILGIITYSFIFYVFHIIWRKIRKKDITIFTKFLQKFLLSISIFILLATAGIGYFGYYQTVQNPLELSQVTLSNGDKTVVFQQMVHIGSPEYYQQITDDINKYKQEGFVYFFEGIRPGTQENMDKFNAALGIKFTPDLYENMSIIYGLVQQDNSKFLNQVNDKDFNIDQSIDDIIKKYEALKIEKNLENQTYKTPIDINSQLVETLAQLEGRELELLQFINKAILSFITKNSALIGDIQDNFGNKELFEIILKGRDITVANEIIQSEYKQIFATYGALHFDGILKLLQENDANWKIVSSKKFYPFK